MKVLWIVNTVLPDLAKQLNIGQSASGTWLIHLSNELAKRQDIELAVACIHGDRFSSYDIAGIRYYVLPGTGKNMLFYTKKYESIWKEIYSSFKPDIVHIHGTEYSHGLAFIRACPEAKTIVSIQGVLNRIKDVDFGELPKRYFIWNRTLNQNLHLNGEIELHYLHKKNAKHEKEMLQKVKYINCVNTWDASLCSSINPNLKVYRIEYNLREEFYSSDKWNIERVKRHTIFTNPGSVPLKGLHQLIRALAIVKNRYGDVNLVVPGMGKDGKLIINNAYAKIISKLIQDLNLENNITFLGQQSTSQMIENLLAANAVVIPSAIEGTSLILREAMYLGCPSICSFRGGMADYISDKVDGFLYDFQEYPYLAHRIIELFDNDELCKRFSCNAIIKSEEAHFPMKNIEKNIEMYIDVLRDNRG